MSARIAYDEVEVGTELPPLAVPLQRVNLVMYAGASGDFNPIHWNERFAKAVGLPDVIAHGMLTMASAGRIVTDWVGDPGAVIEYGVRFTRPVVVPDDDRGARVEITAVVAEKRDDGTVRVWDAGTGRPVGDPLTGHTGRVNAVAVGQVEGRTVIASGSDDRSVRVWDAQLRRASVPLPLVDVASPVAAVVLGDSGQLAVGAELGVILIRRPVG